MKEFLTRRNCLGLEKSQLGLNCSSPRPACILEKLEAGLGRYGCFIWGFLSSRAGTSDMEFMKPTLWSGRSSFRTCCCSMPEQLAVIKLFTSNRVNYARLHFFFFFRLLRSSRVTRKPKLTIVGFGRDGLTSSVERTAGVCFLPLKGDSYCFYCCFLLLCVWSSPPWFWCWLVWKVVLITLLKDARVRCTTRGEKCQLPNELQQLL